MKFPVLIFLFSLFMVVDSIAQMVSGTDIPEFGKTFGVDVNRTEYTVSAYLIESSVRGNILWPNDAVTLTIQLKNNSAKEVSIAGTVEVISYGTRGRPDDIWTPLMFKNSEIEKIQIDVKIPSGGFQNITINPNLPKTFGAFGIVTDLGEYGRQFITSCARTFAAQKESIQYPSFCLDDNSNEVLERLGVHAIRHGVEYRPTTDPDFETWYEAERQRLLAYKKSDIAVLVKMGAPDAYSKIHPLGIPRPWLDDKGVMQNTKTDMAWMPQYDDDFKKLVYKLASEFGWPKGPVNAFALWNEPWEGISISGWGADIPRYKEIYIKMAEAVEEARRDAGVDVLVGGCSSTSNALDKLFADGTDQFLDRFDFCSIHYQGMMASSTIKKWVDRKSNRGRVKIWDTESWVANVDDRVAAVVATNRSAGYDRAMGIYWGNICEIVDQSYLDEDGKEKTTEIIHAWSVAPAIGAAQHFLGERKFKELLFKNGLPWISVFEGLNGNKEDGTVIVVGDIGEEFGPGNVLFRTARGLEEQKQEQHLRQQLGLLTSPDDQSKIDSILQRIEKNEILSNATLSLNDSSGMFQLFDFYGNRVASVKNIITVPLDGRGFFLRSDGSPDSFQKLIENVKQASIKGIEPLETIAFDFTSPVTTNPELTLKLTNILNRPVKGSLDVSIKNIVFESPSTPLHFEAHETKFVKLKVKSAKASTDNLYPLELIFDGGIDGKSIHHEILHVNVISKRTIEVDGKLEDWAHVLPQIIKADGASTTSLTEAAWFPFKNFETSAKGGIASGYLAYDENYFYFAAKISDGSVDEGMRRFETLNADEFFYPENSYIPYNGFQFSGAMKHDGISFSSRWTGELKPDHSGSYTFYLPCKGQARLWIDGKLLIDGWASGFEAEGIQPNEATVLLKKNKHYNIKIEFAKDIGDASISLLWKSKRYEKGLVPTSALFSKDNLTRKGNGLTSEWFNGKNFNVLRTNRIDRAINFNWAKDDVPDPSFLKAQLLELKWPSDVRRYSYRKDTETPFGNFSDHDNVQIAFNVLNDTEKELYPFPPGTMKGYTNYQCTDYEYALNPVAEQYGGGTELWRSKIPGMPHKHFFPRQAPSTLDGPVKDGKLKIVREGNTRVVEVAIPWSEIPVVKMRMDSGQNIKFSFRVNDNTPNGCMELAYKRSVSKINGSFKVDWKEHWANEVEFSFENSQLKK